MLNKLERQAADVLKTKSLLRSEQELRQKLDKLDPGLEGEMYVCSPHYEDYMMCN